MERNIEIKAHIESIEALAQKVAAIADRGPIEIVQDDTFFRCESGRLKLRAFSNQEGELIVARISVSSIRPGGVGPEAPKTLSRRKNTRSSGRRQRLGTLS